MKNIFVILSPGSSGGTGTLSIRISMELMRRKEEVIFICQEFTDFNNIVLLERQGVKVLQIEKKHIYNNLIQLYGNNSRFVILSYTLNEFLFAEKLRLKLKIQKNILYVVHENELTKGMKFSKTINKFVRFIYKPLIKNIVLNSNVIFMDDSCIQELNKFYNLKLDIINTKIIQLPIVVNNINLSEIKNKISLDTFNILTIARAELPFKGYIIGLLDDFERLCKSHFNINLSIISFGRDQNKILEKYNSLPLEIRNKVELVGQVPYWQLGDHFSKSHLFIGMGTTLLDAANHGVPSIVVKSYTLSNISSGLFHEHPNMLSAHSEVMKSAFDIIENIISMNEEEYIKLCISDNNALKKNYDIDTFVDELIANNRPSDKKVNSLFLFVHYIATSINEIYNKLTIFNRKR